MDWYPWYFDLYEQDTMHLDPYQDGCYRRLIDHYMKTRAALPDSDAALARIVGDSLANWVANGAAMVRPFFKPKNGRLYLSRCEMILENQDKSTAKLSESGKKGAEKRWSKIKDIDSHPMAAPIAPPIAPPMSPAIAEERRGKESKKESPLKPPQGGVRVPSISAPEIGMAFETLWNAYPGITRTGEISAAARGSKTKAREIFTNLVTKEKNYETLIRSIQRGAEGYAGFLAKTGSCSRHLTTWLNQRGWDDDYEIRGVQTGRSAARPGADSFDLALEDRTRNPDPADVERWNRKWNPPVADDETGGGLLAPPTPRKLPESEG